MKRSGPLLLALLCACGWFLINLLYLSHYLDLDIVKYYHDQAAGRLLHPHHLLFSLQGYLAVELARLLGYTGHAMFVLQMVVLIWSSVLVALIFLGFFRLCQRLLPAFLLTALVFFSHGVWSYATLNDTPLIPALLALLTLLLGLNKANTAQRRTAGGNIRSGLAIATLHTLAVGFHQTMLLLLPGLVLILCFPPPGQNRNRGHRLLLPGSYILFTFFMVSILYAGSGLLSGLDFVKRTPFPGIPAGLNFFEWVLVYGHWDRSVGWGTFERYDITFRIASGAAGMLLSRSSFPALTAKPLRTWLQEAPDLGSLLVLLYLGSLLFSIVFLLLRGREAFAPLAGTLLWLVSASTLASWWEPEHYEHWFAAFMASVALLSLCLRFWGRLLWPVLPLLLFFVLSMASWNFQSTIKPRNQSVVFGYWEDLYDMGNYTNIWNHIYRRPLPVQSGSGNQSARRAERRERLQKLLENEGLRDFHAKYRKELEQVEAAIERTEKRNPD